VCEIDIEKLDREKEFMSEKQNREWKKRNVECVFA
jgi:hypothetical protein